MTPSEEFKVNLHPNIFVDVEIYGDKAIVVYNSDYKITFVNHDKSRSFLIIEGGGKKENQYWLNSVDEYTLKPIDETWAMSEVQEKMTRYILNDILKFNVGINIITKKESEETIKRHEDQRQERFKEAEQKRLDKIDKISSTIDSHPLISKVKTVQDVKKAMRAGRYIGGGDSKTLWHGSGSPQSKLLPSVLLRSFNGGGGYGERYWGVSLTGKRKTAEIFSGDNRNGVYVHEVVVKSNAVIMDLSELFDDSNNIDDSNIVDLWNRADIVYIGGGEDEYIVLNPSSISIKSRDYKGFNRDYKKSDVKIDEVYKTIKKLS